MVFRRCVLLLLLFLFFWGGGCEDIGVIGNTVSYLINLMKSYADLNV